MRPLNASGSPKKALVSSKKIALPEVMAEVYREF
jgi:hypothetical protein